MKKIYQVVYDDKHDLAWFRFALYGKLIEDLTGELIGYVITDITEKVYYENLNQKIELYVTFYGKENCIRVD